VWLGGCVSCVVNRAVHLERRGEPVAPTTEVERARPPTPSVGMPTVSVKGEATLGPPSGDVLNPVATLLSLSGGKGAGTGRAPPGSLLREKRAGTNTGPGLAARGSVRGGPQPP